MAQRARRRYLIVDGHSIIFQWDDLRAIQARHPRKARDELVRRLTAYQDASNERVVVVFDASGSASRRQSPAGKEPGIECPSDIQVVFARAGSTADSVIERLVAAHAAENDLTIATADEAERLTVSSLGAWWISPDGLRDRLDRAAAEASRRLKPHAHGRRPFRLGDAFTSGKPRPGSKET
jgi:predicted RNA-binding protein with PIN domain